jgi:hypothetical protein
MTRSAIGPAAIACRHDDLVKRTRPASFLFLLAERRAARSGF